LKDCTAALPSSPVPPPTTRYVPFTTAPAASCTGWASDPAGCALPVDGSTRTTLPVVCLAASRPPSTNSCFPSVRTTSRDDGDGSFHGAAVMVSAPPARVVAGADDADDVDAVVDGELDFDRSPPPPPPQADTNSASAPTATTDRTRRGTGAPLHTKHGGRTARHAKYR